MATPEDELRSMAEFEALAERAYDDMYKEHYAIGRLGLYSDFKDFFARAIDAADRAGRPDDAARLSKRRDHCREVYRKQFDY